jgi:hypothetical protein
MLNRILSAALAAGAALALAIGVTSAEAATGTYWGPHGGVATVHTPGPYLRRPVGPVPVPWHGPCCYAPYGGLGAVAAGAAVGTAVGAAAAAAHPYPYPYGYPVVVAPRPVVYPAPVVVAAPPVVVYPAKPLP